MNNCADCGGPIGEDRGPPDGWQLEDGRTVCHACCMKDTGRIVDAVLACGVADRKARGVFNFQNRVFH